MNRPVAALARLAVVLGATGTIVVLLSTVYRAAFDLYATPGFEAGAAIMLVASILALPALFHWIVRGSAK